MILVRIFSALGFVEFQSVEISHSFLANSYTLNNNLQNAVTFSQVSISKNNSECKCSVYLGLLEPRKCG